MNVGILYALTALVSMMQIILILNRTKATKYKETIEVPFCRMLCFFIVFCFIDMFWGICESHLFFESQTVYTVVSYGYHSVSALSAFIWYGYGIYYTKTEGRRKYVLNFLRGILLLIQLLLLSVNTWTNGSFRVDSDGIYHTGRIRTLMYMLQFSYYIIFILYALFMVLKEKENRTVYKSSVIFSLVLLIFGIGQYIFYDAAMYSLGFMFSSFIIYSFNVTVQREAYMELKNKEQSLITRERESELKNQAKSTFLFNMSHDIRTPMNAIIGYSNMLEKYRNDDEKFFEYLKNVKDAGQHLLCIINDVLEMSRIESGKISIDDDELCNADELNGTVISVFGEELRKKNLTLESSVNVEHKYVYCDSTKLREIFQNIISNSVKYTCDGGHITFDVEEIPCDREGYANYLTVISDNGIGMSKEFLPHIFDSFERERTATESKVAGTGLGMGITKRLVELMGGTIEVESELGVGTTVRVCIPHRIAEKDDIAQKAQENEVKIDKEQFRGMRILVAEDNDLNAKIILELLRDYGFEVERAEDGIACVDMMEKAPERYYRLVFMDVQMPNMNGYKATELIRSLPEQWKKEIPVVAMTANAFDTDRNNALAAGMDDFLSKPINMKELRRILSKMCTN